MSLGLKPIGRMFLKLKIFKIRGERRREKVARYMQESSEAVAKTYIEFRRKGWREKNGKNEEND